MLFLTKLVCVFNCWNVCGVCLGIVYSVSMCECVCIACQRDSSPDDQRSYFMTSFQPCHRVRPFTSPSSLPHPPCLLLLSSSSPLLILFPLLHSLFLCSSPPLFSPPLPAPPAAPSQAASLARTNTRQIGARHSIKIQRGSKGFGFGLTSRDVRTDDHNQMVYVKSVHHEGPAYQDGRLRIGDRILEVRERIVVERPN